MLVCRFPKEVSAIFDQILAILLLSNLEEGSNSGVTSFFQIKRDSVSFTSFLQITFLENSQLKGSNSRTVSFVSFFQIMIRSESVQKGSKLPSTQLN